MKRRSFIRLSGASLLASLSSKVFARKVEMPEVGLFLGPFKEMLAAQPMQTLETIQKAGIRDLELFDILLLARLQPALSGMGFKINTSHFASPFITGNWAPMQAFGMRIPPASYTFNEVVNDAVKFGLTHLVFPYIFPEDRGGLGDYQRLAEKLNQAGESCQKAGIQLCFHPHAYDFQPMEDSSPMQVILSETNPELLKLEVDTFWLSLAGVDPAAFIRDHTARIRLAHLADIKAETPKILHSVTLPPSTYQPPGKGSLDFVAIKEALQQAKIAQAYLDLENVPNPLEALSESLAHLSKG
ncbi:MAG: sugar phosphate isomerase/epimerase family protein [bacterium]